MGGTAAASPLVPVPLLTPLERQTNGFPSSSYSNVTIFFFFFQGPEQKSVCFRSYYCVWNNYQAVSSSLNCFFLVLRVQAEFYIANL